MAGLWNKFKSKFQKLDLSEKVTNVFKSSNVTDDTYEDLIDTLIMADISVDIAEDMVAKLKKSKPKDADEANVFLASYTKELLTPKETNIIPKGAPFVFCAIGVNGSGKTTVLAKLANLWKSEGYKVALVAADTFRAAAVDQLKTWAERVDVPIFTASYASDPASLVYESFEQAKDDGIDILLIDTAGRLHNREDLMEELKKIIRVLKKHGNDLPHHTALVLDATTGQNCLNQIKLFKETTGISSLIINKLDGTAKGGIAFYKEDSGEVTPISYIGLGEKIDDVETFNADDFADNIFKGEIK